MKYSEFKKYLHGKRIKLKDFAEWLGITYTALTYKFKGEQNFTVKQIAQIAIKFQFTNEQIVEYFFKEGGDTWSLEND